MGILSSIFGGAFGAGPVDGHVGTEEGFVDIDLPISEVKQNRDGSVTIVARGKVNGSVVGLIVDVLPEWEGKEIEGGGATFYWGRARYRSLGEESDRFVAMLAQLYGITPRPMKMLPRIEVSAVGLNDDPMQILETSVKMKFFFEEDSEEGYAEVFTNVDIPNRKFEFHEKDPEYRVPLVQALSGGT